MAELDKTGLEPCPFCGGEASLRNGGPGCFFVQCDMCNATSDDRAQDTAIKAWNSRATATSAGVTEERPERVTAAFAVWREHPETGPNASALFEYIEHLETALEASRVAPASQKEAEPVAAKYPLATFGDPDVLPLGLFRIHWASGGSSLAAVGMMENGDRWIAPTNWISPCLDPTNEFAWGGIERAEPIPSPAPAVEPAVEGK